MSTVVQIMYALYHDYLLLGTVLCLKSAFFNARYVVIATCLWNQSMFVMGIIIAGCIAVMTKGAADTTGEHHLIAAVSSICYSFYSFALVYT